MGDLDPSVVVASVEHVVRELLTDQQRLVSFVAVPAWKRVFALPSGRERRIRRGLAHIGRMADELGKPPYAVFCLSGNLRRGRKVLVEHIILILLSRGKGDYHPTALTVEWTPDGPVVDDRLPETLGGQGTIFQSPTLDAFWQGVEHGAKV